MSPLNSTDMAAATSLPEHFFMLCIDAGYLKPERAASDAERFDVFWSSPSGRKRLTKAETIREMVSRVVPGDMPSKECKSLARDIFASLSGEGPMADELPEFESVDSVDSTPELPEPAVDDGVSPRLPR